MPQNKIEGRAMLDREIQRLGVNDPPMPELLAELKLPSTDALHEALGLGEDQRRAIGRGDPAPAPSARARPEDAARAARAGRARPELEIQGIGDLLSTYARCCKPVPPEPIVGYITVGRGVSIQANPAPISPASAVKSPARVLRGRLGQEARRTEFPVDIEVQAFDRRGLVAT